MIAPTCIIAGLGRNLGLGERKRSSIDLHNMSNIHVCTLYTPFIWMIHPHPDILIFILIVIIRSSLMMRFHLFFVDLLDVPGATGDYRTDLMAKAHQALNTLMDESLNYDMGFIHIKAVDDCGHDRNVHLKIEFLEKIDTMIRIIHQRVFQEITLTSSLSKVSMRS
jgi:hypothetical protein